MHEVLKKPLCPQWGQSLTLGDLREIVLADIAQGVKEPIERLLQSVPLSPRGLFHPLELHLGVDRHRNMTPADPFLTFCCSEKIRVSGGVTIGAGYDPSLKVFRPTSR